MSCSAAVSSVVCQEVFDDNSQPSEEEIREYAIRVGIDPDSEPHLLPIARDGVMKALPPNWVPVFDKNLSLYYYFNQQTNKASWEHPVDGEIRDLVRKCKLESNSSTADDDSKTSLKDELKSYEEVASVGNEINMHSWNQNIPALSGTRRPLSATPQPPPLLTRRTPSHDKSPNDEPISRPSTSFIGRFAVDKVSKIDIDRPLQRLEQDDETPGQERSQRVANRSKFTLTGGGSMFLKSNQPKPREISSPTKSIDVKVTDATATTPVRSPSVDEPRGILRAPSADKPLWDRNPRELTSTERNLWRQQELEDDRKYVRFSLEKGLDISFKLSEEEDDDDDDDDDDDFEEDDDDNLMDVLSKEGAKDVSKETTSVDNIYGRSRSGNERSETQKMIDGLFGVPLSVELKAAANPNVDDLPSPMKVSDSLIKIRQLPSSSQIESILERSQKALKPNSLSPIKRRPVANENVWDRRKETEGKDTKAISGVRETADRQSEGSVKTEPKKTTVIDLRPENMEDMTSSEQQRDDSDGKADSSSSSDQKLSGSDQKESVSDRNESGSDQRESGSDRKESGSDQKESGSDQKGSDSDLKETDSDQKGAGPSEKSSKEEGVEKRSDKGKGDSSEREKALREWNVVSGLPYRPPLSRQSSQQQLIRKSEAELTGERERAYRDWNVTGIVQELDEALQGLQEKENAVKGEKTGKEEITAKDEQTSKEGKTVAKDKESKSDASSISADLADRLSLFAKIEKEHRERLALEEMEHRKRLDEIEKEHKERLKRIEEEHRTAAEKAEAEETEKQMQRQKSWKESMQQEEQEWRIRLQLSKEEQKRAISDMQHEHHKAMAALETENQADILRLREKHTADLQNLREQFHKEKEALRKELAERIESTREERAAHRSSDSQDHARALERVRCEKHLLEDKYHILKEKYVYLKKEVSSAIQRREQRKAETDASTSFSHTRTSDKTSTSSKRQHPRSHHSQQQQPPPPPPPPPRQGQQQQQSQQGQHQQNQQGQQQQNQQGQQQQNQQGQQQQNQQGQQQQNQQGQQQQNQQGQQQQNQQGQQQQQGQEQGQQQQGHQQQEHQQQEQKQGQGNQQQEQGKQQQQQQQQDNDQKTDDSSFCALDSDNNNSQQTKKGRSGNVAAQVMWWNSSHLEENKEKANEKKPQVSTPMDTLRKQLRTLDELEERFPVSALADTYLPYPFPEEDRELGSSELEFFRHRIHLEQDLVRQARNLLRAQHNVYLTRLHNLKIQQTACGQNVDASVPTNPLSQMAQEEEELSQMEAGLQRTRSLLCEKIIRLRRLENSLRVVSDTERSAEKPSRSGARRERPEKKLAWELENSLENSIPDYLSDSGESSGRSNKDFVPNPRTSKTFSKDDDFRKGIVDPLLFYDDSNDINASLHNLNAEISEIWSVLCRQRAVAGLGPPPLLASRSSTPNVWIPPRTIANAQPPLQNDVGLVERARNLRRWLQKAKMSATIIQSDSSMKHQMSL